MDRDFIILNGDTIISDEIVAKLVAGANEPINVTVDVKSEYDDDDMKVNRDAEGRLHHIGKRLLPPTPMPNRSACSRSSATARRFSATRSTR